MDNLYKKIYEAINNGILESLNIDNEQKNDISIGWKGSKISNGADMYKYHVSELIENKDAASYNMLIEYYKSVGKKYKVSTFDELLKIYDVILDVNSELSDNIDNDANLEWVETSNVLSIYESESFKEISFNELLTGEYEIRLLKFKNTICGHDIIVDINNLRIDNAYYWQKSTDLVNFDNLNCFFNKKDARQDYNGYENTYNNINIPKLDYKTIMSYPAFQYCVRLNNAGLYPSNYKAYLPALGELMLVDKAIFLISYLLETANMETEDMFLTQDRSCIWTSTEYSDKAAWTLREENIFDIIDSEHIKPLEKDKSQCYVFPLLKEI